MFNTGALAVSPIIMTKSKGFDSKITNQMSPKIVRNEEGKNQIVLGDHQIVKLSGNDTNGAFTLIEQNNNPNMGIPMHVHQDEDEVFHVISGELQIQVGTETIILKSGDMGFCPRGVPHSWKVVGNKKAKVMLSIFPSGLEMMFEELSKLPSGPPELDKLAKICSKYNIQFV